MIRAPFVLWSDRVVGRPAGRDRVPSRFDALSSLAAMAALAASVASAVIEQSPAEPARPAEAARSAADVTTRAPPTAELMVAGYAGAPYTYPSDVTVKKGDTRDLTAKDVPWDGKPFEEPIYYGVRILRWLGAGATGAMLDFTHSKTISQPGAETDFSGTIDGKPAPERAKVSDVFRRLEASHGHNMLTLNGLFRLPSIGLRFHPYVGLGAGVALPHSEVQLVGDPARTYEYQYAGPVGQALIGVELRIPRVSIFVEYKFTLASYEMPLTHQDGSILFLDLWRQLGRWWRGEEPPGGRVWTNLVSHQAIAGLGIRFAATPAAP